MGMGALYLPMAGAGRGGGGDMSNQGAGISSEQDRDIPDVLQYLYIPSWAFSDAVIRGHCALRALTPVLVSSAADPGLADGGGGQSLL